MIKLGEILLMVATLRYIKEESLSRPCIESVPCGFDTQTLEPTQEVFISYVCTLCIREILKK